jgi:TatD DNase family protein
MIFDSHAHYDDEAFEEDRETLLNGMKGDGVGAIVNMGANLRGVRDTVALAEAYPNVYGGVGLHPDHVDELNEEVMEELRQYCGRKKIVAVGEIGLDYYWDKHPRTMQKEWFVRQLALAKEQKLPVNIHSREAAQDTFDILKAEHAGTTGGIIHCYSGSKEMARDYLNLGYYLGVGGVVTFKNARVLKEVVAYTPLDRLVVETDCPYLAPTPFRGKRNDSRMIRYVLEVIAELKGVSREEAELATWNNARNVYGITDVL